MNLNDEQKAMALSLEQRGERPHLISTLGVVVAECGGGSICHKFIEPKYYREPTEKEIRLRAKELYMSGKYNYPTDLRLFPNTNEVSLYGTHPIKEANELAMNKSKVSYREFMEWDKYE